MRYTTGGSDFPYLFLPAAKGLSCLLIRVMTKGDITRIQISPFAPRVNHILFMDDCLLFNKAATADAIKIMEVLNNYLWYSMENTLKHK